MKLLKLGIRFWITLTSIFSFLAGWILLAHAQKPDQANSPEAIITAPLPTLEPLSPLPDIDSDEDSFRNQPFFNSGPSFNSQPRPSFRTGGS